MRWAYLNRGADTVRSAACPFRRRHSATQSTDCSAESPTPGSSTKRRCSRHTQRHSSPPSLSLPSPSCMHYNDSVVAPRQVSRLLSGHSGRNVHTRAHSHPTHKRTHANHGAKLLHDDTCVVLPCGRAHDNHQRLCVFASRRALYTLVFNVRSGRSTTRRRVLVGLLCNGDSTNPYWLTPAWP
jgi:hypothetical protein